MADSHGASRGTEARQSWGVAHTSHGALDQVLLNGVAGRRTARGDP